MAQNSKITVKVEMGSALKYISRTLPILTLSSLASFIPFVMLPTNPYVLTAIVICAASIAGLFYFSIPLVITVLTMVATFILMAWYQQKAEII